MADFLFLLALILIGSWFSYEDIKLGKIKNFPIIILILVGLFLNYYNQTFLENPSVFFFNIFSGIAMGLIIWLAGFWSAADAKLYIGLVILFPVTWFEQSNGYFPGFAILINSTLPLFLFLAFQTLIQTNSQDKIRAIKTILKSSLIAHLVIIATGLAIFFGSIQGFLKIKLDYVLMILLLLFLFWLIEDKLKIKITYFFIFIIILSLIFSPSLINPRFLITILIFVSLILLVLFITSLSFPLYTKELKIGELKEGMILAEMILEEKGKLSKRPPAILTYLTALRERMKLKPIFGYNPDGLKINEIEEIQQLEKRGLLGFNTIRIAKTMPFAPALFLGTLMTYFLRSSFIEIIF